MWNVEDRSSSHQFEREGRKLLNLSQAGATEAKVVDDGRWMVDGGWWVVDGLVKKIWLLTTEVEKGHARSDSVCYQVLQYSPYVYRLITLRNTPRSVSYKVERVLYGVLVIVLLVTVSNTQYAIRCEIRSTHYGVLRTLTPCSVLRTRYHRWHVVASLVPQRQRLNPLSPRAQEFSQEKGRNDQFILSMW